MKTCSTCKNSKPFDEFFVHQKTSDGRNTSCKLCDSIRKKKYYAENKIKIDLRCKAYNATNADEKCRRDRAYFQRNIEAIRVRTANYYLDNKSAVIERRREYQAERRKNDPNYRLQVALRKRLNSALKQNWKAGSAVSDLGCSVAELKLHLESQFQPGMTWKNWSKTGWHIDHIKPLASFDLTDREQFLQAVHYTNLQPLWAADNLKKSASVCP